MFLVVFRERFEVLLAQLLVFLNFFVVAFLEEVLIFGLCRVKLGNCFHEEAVFRNRLE